MAALFLYIKMDMLLVDMLQVKVKQVVQKEKDNAQKGEMPKGNARKIWTDSNCTILQLLIHKYFLMHQN